MPNETTDERLWVSERRECLLTRVHDRHELHLRLQGRLVRIEVCADERTARERAAIWHAIYCALDAYAAPRVSADGRA